jgi:hypothetical protein
VKTRWTGRDSKGLLHILDRSAGDRNMNSFFVTRCAQSYYDTIDILEELPPTCVQCIAKPVPP